MPNKPFPYKAYGSIGHVEGSKLGYTDRYLPKGQSDILLGKPRSGDNVIVQMKMDGSCCAVAKKQGRVIALQRSGYEASSSTYEQHQKFARFVSRYYDVFDFVLSDGERLVGEWLYKTHTIRYMFDSQDDLRLFQIFDLFDENNQCKTYDVLQYRLKNTDLVKTPLVNVNAANQLRDYIPYLVTRFDFSSSDMNEGFVFRCEREGRVDFLGKYVRKDFEPGKYLDTDMINVPF